MQFRISSVLLAIVLVLFFSHSFASAETMADRVRKCVAENPTMCPGSADSLIKACQQIIGMAAQFGYFIDEKEANCMIFVNELQVNSKGLTIGFVSDPARLSVTQASNLRGECIDIFMKTKEPGRCR